MYFCEEVKCDQTCDFSQKRMLADNVRNLKKRAKNIEFILSSC